MNRAMRFGFVAVLALALGYQALRVYAGTLDWGPATFLLDRLWFPSMSAEWAQTMSEDTYSLWKPGEGTFPAGGGMEPLSVEWFAVAAAYACVCAFLTAFAIRRIRRATQLTWINSFALPGIVVAEGAGLMLFSWPTAIWQVVLAILFWGCTSVGILWLATLPATPPRASEPNSDV